MGGGLGGLSRQGLLKGPFFAALPNHTAFRFNYYFAKYQLFMGTVNKKMPHDFLNCKPWGEVKINLSLTGDEPVWKTSKNEFSDSECQNLGFVPNAGSFQGCIALCQEKSRCTAFNYENSSTSCVLRGCPLPIVPPAQNYYLTFDGYWKSSASTGSFIESRSKNN